MIEVKNRSLESWGPLAKCTDEVFDSIINNRKGNTKDLIKDKIKKQKKLKTYKVTFEKHFCSDQFEIQAEDDYSVGSAARAYFKANEHKIGFVAKARTPWADSYAGYDRISYVKVK